MLSVFSPLCNVGHAIIRHLVACGARARGLVSQESSAPRIAALGAMPCVSNLRDDAALEAAFESIDTERS